MSKAHIRGALTARKLDGRVRLDDNDGRFVAQWHSFNEFHRIIDKIYYAFACCASRDDLDFRPLVYSIRIHATSPTS